MPVWQILICEVKGIQNMHVPFISIAMEKAKCQKLTLRPEYQITVLKTGSIVRIDWILISKE